MIRTRRSSTAAPRASSSVLKTKMQHRSGGQLAAPLEAKVTFPRRYSVCPSKTDTRPLSFLTATTWRWRSEGRREARALHGHAG